MRSTNSPSGLGSRSLQCLLIVSVVYFCSGRFVVLAQAPSPAAVAPAQPPAVTPPAEAAPKIPNDQLDALVAPIALYPDPLLAQTLAASTYPLEIVLLQQWLEKNKNLKDKAFTDAVQKQTWDPSIQAMASLPEVAKKLADNISWTSDLGNAFLSQQADVMDAVQRMRAKANAAGKLKSTPQMKVESKVVETKTVVVIEQADPKVVYVPTYNPTVVYGTSVYPYPPIYYPPATGAVLAFGAGIALGAAWNNGWGYNCGWGNNNVNINVNNNYVNHYNKTNVNNVNRNNINNVSGNTWKHDAQHRGGVPYSNKATAQQYGGNARTQPSNVNRPDSPRQQPSFSDRSAGGDRQRPASSDRSLGGDRQKPAISDRSNAASNRTQNKSFAQMDRLSSNQFSRDSSPRTNNAFSGPSNRMDRSSSFASHDRGSRSMSSASRGGGMQRSMSRGGGRRR